MERSTQGAVFPTLLRDWNGFTCSRAHLSGYSCIRIGVPLHCAGCAGSMCIRNLGNSSSPSGFPQKTFTILAPMSGFP